MSGYRITVAKHEIELEGTLEKQTEVLKRWKKRYFCLRNENLHYYKSASKKGRVRTIPLNITKVTAHPSDQRRFQVHSGMKKLELKASSAEEASCWVDAISLGTKLISVADSTDCTVQEARPDDPIVFSVDLIRRLSESLAKSIQEVANIDDEIPGVKNTIDAALKYRDCLDIAMQLVQDQMARNKASLQALPKQPAVRMTVIEAVDQKIEEDVFYDAVDEQNLYVSIRGYRTALPAKRDPNQKFNIWKVIKDSIGGDLSKITVPVIFNEPLSFLQRFTEDVAYSDVLLKAAECEDSCLRMAYVCCFALSTYSFTVDRTLKPFNPLLGETFELDVNGLRVISEQVSHHPPVSAIHCMHDAFEFWGSTQIKTSFRGTYLQVKPHGKMHVWFRKWGDEYVWEKPETSVHNLIIGKVYLDHHGTLVVRNTRTGDSAKVCLRKRGWFGKNQHMVEGMVLDSTNTPRFLISGTWSQSLIIRNDLTGEEITGWESSPMPPNSELYYHFPEWSLQLNVTPETYGQLLPPTDSRRRPDQRALEEGNTELANTEKQRLEEKQRAARKARESSGEEYAPKWFLQHADEWRYLGGYWEAKAAGSFQGCQNIF